MKLLFILSIFFLFQQLVCAQEARDTICILQLNDVYEIGPLEQGRVGGMARVATLVKQHEDRYQTFVVLAGDFVSPSVIGTTKIDGMRVNGKHMVDIMNKVGMDLVTFGNHEFDIPEPDLQQRLNESSFSWVSSNAFQKDSNGTVRAFYRTRPDSVAIPTYQIFSSANNQIKVGIVSATIYSNPAPFVSYTDNVKSMKKAYRQVKRNSDVVIALTHLSLGEDEHLLRKMKKRIPLIMGGHEHQHNYVTIRKGSIAKADANAKTMYRHLIYRTGKRGRITISSTLVNVDSTVVPDAAVEKEVKAWEDKAYASFRAVGLEPEAVVYRTSEPLDGTEASVRYKQTNLGKLINAAMLAASPKADASVLNSGSIRIDDMITGVVTQLDVIRTLPFGGKICEVDLTGTLLNQMLTTSNNLKSLGGYLQTSSNLVFDGTNWLLNGSAIDNTRTYKIVTPEFLFSGNEKGMEFLKDGNPEIRLITKFQAPNDIHTDIRLAVVKYLSGLELR